MKGAATPMATRGQNMPYTTGHSRYFSIEYTDLNYVPRVFLGVENTLNRPAFTTVYLNGTDQSAYVDQNLIGAMLPNDIWDVTGDANNNSGNADGDDLLSILDELMAKQ